MLPIKKHWEEVISYHRVVILPVPYKEIPLSISISATTILLFIGLFIIGAMQACMMITSEEILPTISAGQKEEKLITYEDIELDTIDIPEVESNRDMFLRIKHTLISQVLIKNHVSRLDQLKDSKMTELNKQLTESFVEIVLKNSKPQAHVLFYFTDTKDLNKIETALMEQAKYHVPASIKLAQSALETAYGQRIIDNNYFGIKGKSTKSTTTTEYYTLEEKKINQKIIQSSVPVIKNGIVLYKCIVKDFFAEYESPWHSFRAHSEFLSTNKRYAPLFTKGKDYKDWADKIGSTKNGGVGYATSPIYGEILKKIVERYHLDLLDY